MFILDVCCVLWQIPFLMIFIFSINYSDISIEATENNNMLSINIEWDYTNSIHFLLNQFD